MAYARDERLALCALLADLGPDQPTLCSGWKTADLAAHLVLRERRPDAGAGVLGGPLARYTQRVQTRLSERVPYPKLIELIAAGPPRTSVFGLPRADEQLNLVEYFIHHEDVRRAQPGAGPRELVSGLPDALWGRLGLARFILRKAPVGVELVRTDRPASGNGRVRLTVRARTPVVTVTGTPAELTLWVAGRTGAAKVTLDGNDADVASLTTTTWKL